MIGLSHPRRAIIFGCVLTISSAACITLPSFQPKTRSAVLDDARSPAFDGIPWGFAPIINAVKPSVFSIRARVLDTGQPSLETPFDRGFAPGSSPTGRRAPGSSRVSTSQGTGFFISADGFAVTNNHVIKGSKTVEIRTDDKKTYRARVVAADAASDLALLKVDGRDDFPYARFADGRPQVGDWIVTVGNPFGLGGTVTAGIVSAQGRDIVPDSFEDLLQIDAPINRGSSGGPTFDLGGYVVGINTMIYSPTGGWVGIAFNIPADRASVVISQLKDKGVVTRGWLGMQVQPVSPEIAESMGLARAEGVLVSDVMSDGPAGSAGLTPGDVIHSLNGQPLLTAHDYARTLYRLEPGTQATLGITRNGRKRKIEAVIGQEPTTTGHLHEGSFDEQVTSLGRSDWTQLGLSILPPGIPNVEGVVVTDVDPEGLAADRGIDPGDIIVTVFDRKVSSEEDIEKAFRHARKAGKQSLLMRVRSGQKTQFIVIPTR